MEKSNTGHVQEMWRRRRGDRVGTDNCGHVTQKEFGDKDVAGWRAWAVRGGDREIRAGWDGR